MKPCVKIYQVLKKCPEDSTDSIITFWANLSELINFYSSWNHQKTLGILKILGVIKVI